MNEREAWTFFYGALVGGASADPDATLNLVNGAKVADEMLDEWRKRWGGGCAAADRKTRTRKAAK